MTTNDINKRSLDFYAVALRAEIKSYNIATTSLNNFSKVIKLSGTF